MVLAALALGACSQDPKKGPTGNGNLSGQVVVSGPLVGAKVSVDQIDLMDPTGAVRDHVGDATTDAQGRFSVDTAEFNGVLLMSASGGSYVDLATQATIQLDANAKLESLATLDLFEMRDDALISPVGHMITARMREKLGTYHDVTMAQMDAEEHLDRHFGDVHWDKLKLGTLDAPATSPTEPVRAALIQAALSYLANDIALAAGASPQEVSVFTLTQQLAVDLGDAGHPTFDGNDGNSMNPGGLQVGVCGPVEGCVVPPTGCVVGACRPFCDLYGGTPRALLASEVSKIAALPSVNKTGLLPADILPVARSISDNIDDDLFSSCVENLDRSPPTLFWSSPTPADGSFARGSNLQVQVQAIDDTDPSPHVTITGHTDDDGDPTNNVAHATLDTTTMPDGMVMFEAVATDMSNNKAMSMRTFTIDNTAPVVVLTSTNYLVDGSTWWTKFAGPTLSGTITDVAPASIKATVHGTDYAGTITGSDWSLTLPAGAIDLVGAQVVITAADVAGNTSTAGQLIRYDATPPSVVLNASTMFDEANDSLTFSNTGVESTTEIPNHGHGGAAVDLNAAFPACSSFSKYSYLTFANPPTFGAEAARNPILYHLSTADDGVGLVGASSQYRIGRRDAAGVTQWIVNWTSDGTGTVVGNTTSYGIPVYADQVTGLDSDEGTYDLEFQAIDRLQRPTVLKKCFTLKVLAPPLRFATLISDTTGNSRPMNVGGKSFVSGDAGATAATSHPLALKSMGIGATNTYKGIPLQVINDGLHGASLVDMPVINGSSASVYLTVDVTKPTSVNLSQNYTQRYHTTTANLGTTLDCDVVVGDPRCGPPPTAFPTFDGGAAPPTTPASLDFPVRVFELDSTGALSAELTCAGGCLDTDATFHFTIPARTSTPRRFLVMTMVRRLIGLEPVDASHPDTLPFSDYTIAGIAATGKNYGNHTGCSVHVACANGHDCCKTATTYTGFRAFTSVNVRFDGLVKASLSVSAVSSIQPVAASAAVSSNPFLFSSTQSTFP